MGALPLQFKDRRFVGVAGPDGQTELIDVVPDPALTPQSDARLVIRRADSERTEVTVTLRIDTPSRWTTTRPEASCPYVLRQLLAARNTATMVSIPHRRSMLELQLLHHRSHEADQAPAVPGRNLPGSVIYQMVRCGRPTLLCLHEAIEPSASLKAEDVLRPMPPCCTGASCPEGYSRFPAVADQSYHVACIGADPGCGFAVPTVKCAGRAWARPCGRWGTAA